jgi:uncharacterized Zn finger protein (UPF0148 family)
VLEKAESVDVGGAAAAEAGSPFEFMPYHCPRCGIELDDRGSPSDCMLRCPNCGRPSSPPSQYRRRIVTRTRSSRPAAHQLDEEEEKPRKVGPLRVLLWIAISGLSGVIAAAFMGSVFQTDSAMSNLAGLVTWVAVLLLFAIPRRKRRKPRDRAVQIANRTEPEVERDADIDRSKSSLS